MIKNYDELAEINYIPNWLYTSQQPDKTSIIGSPASETCNALLKLIKHQQKDVHKTCQGSIQIKVSITYQWKRKNRD